MIFEERFVVQWCGHYREETHAYAWGVCDKNSNAVVGWGNPTKEWAERIARALNIVEGQKPPTNTASLKFPTKVESNIICDYCCRSVGAKVACSFSVRDFSCFRGRQLQA